MYCASLLHKLELCSVLKVYCEFFCISFIEQLKWYPSNESRTVLISFVEANSMIRLQNNGEKVGRLRSLPHIFFKQFIHLWTGRKLYRFMYYVCDYSPVRQLVLDTELLIAVQVVYFIIPETVTVQSPAVLYLPRCLIFVFWVEIK